MTAGSVIVTIVVGLILGACAARAATTWRERPRPVQGPDGVWRAARRQTHGWGRP